MDFKDIFWILRQKVTTTGFEIVSHLEIQSNELVWVARANQSVQELFRKLPKMLRFENADSRSTILVNPLRRSGVSCSYSLLQENHFGEGFMFDTHYIPQEYMIVGSWTASCQGMEPILRGFHYKHNIHLQVHKPEKESQMIFYLIWKLISVILWKKWISGWNLPDQTTGKLKSEVDELYKWLSFLLCLYRVVDPYIFLLRNYPTL